MADIDRMRRRLDRVRLETRNATLHATDTARLSWAHVRFDFPLQIFLTPQRSIRSWKRIVLVQSE